jgi:hypothetical protein
MLTWGELRTLRPDLTDAGQALLHRHSVGLGYLATVRKDGGPRIHPICPVLTDEGVFCFLVESPKRADLLRDGRYALHAFPTDDNEDAFYLSGVAEPRTDPTLREALTRVWFEERGLTEKPPDFDEEQVFEFLIDTCLATKTTGYGDYNPQHTVWKA